MFLRYLFMFYKLKQKSCLNATFYCLNVIYLSIHNANLIQNLFFITTINRIL